MFKTKIHLSDKWLFANNERFTIKSGQFFWKFSLQSSSASDLSFTHLDFSELIFFVLRSLTVRYIYTFMYQRILTPQATLSAKIQLQEL